MQQRIQNGDLRTQRGEQPCRRGPPPGNHANTPRTATATQRLPHRPVPAHSHRCRRSFVQAFAKCSLLVGRQGFQQNVDHGGVVVRSRRSHGSTDGVPDRSGAFLASFGLQSFQNKPPKLVPESTCWPCLATAWPRPVCFSGHARCSGRPNCANSWQHCLLTLLSHSGLRACVNCFLARTEVVWVCCVRFDTGWLW